MNIRSWGLGKNEIVILSSLFLLTLSALVQAEQTILWTNNADEITITGFNGDPGVPVGELTIPDTTNGFPVTRIGANAFSGIGLTGVTIPASVTNIGNNAFFLCNYLTNVTINGNGVTHIGDGAFSDCYGLTRVAIGNGVTRIGNSAFYNCYSLTNVTIPGSVTQIGDSAFYYCASLPNVTIPSSVTQIGDSAFCYCEGLTRVTIPGSVTRINNSTFAYCTSLDSVTIGNGVASIGDSAFYGCWGLTRVTIGIGVASIGDSAFYYCTSLTNVTIPVSVTNIGEYAFNYCESLTRVAIPGSVTQINNSTFAYCTSLDSVTIGNGVASIGRFAFEWCAGLTGITIPASVTSIDESAFYCGGMTGLYFEGNAPDVEGGSLETDATVYYLGEATGWTNPWCGRPTALWYRSVTKIVDLLGDLAFGYVITGETGDAMLTIRNTGNSPLTVSSITYPPAFSGAWSGSIAAGDSQNVTVKFSPGAAQSYSGAITVNSDKTSGTGTITASGTGVAPTRILSLGDGMEFDVVLVGASATRTLTICNTGNSALTVSSITYPSSFSGAWSGSIAAGDSQNVTVTFTPSAAQSYSGTITVNSDKTSGTDAITVSGTGRSPARILSLSGNLAFGNVTTGQTAQATLTIMNSGNTALTVSGIAYPARFSGVWSGVIPAGASQGVAVEFCPTAVRAFSGLVTVYSDKTSGENTIRVSGAGVSDPLPDSRSGQICFSDLSYPAQEGTKCKVLVNRINGSEGTVNVRYSMKPRTALAWLDYKPKSGTLTWTNGQTASKVIKIDVLADGKIEGLEAFQIILKDPVGTTLTAPAKATVTILSNFKGGQAAEDPASIRMANLTEALDGCELTWFTSTLSPWMKQAFVTVDGVAAAKSGDISADQTSWLQTELEGAGKLEFAWMVKGSGKDSCLVFVNGKVRLMLMSGYDWSQAALTLGEGDHTVRWVFVGDDGLPSGSAYLDQVKWVPAESVP